MSARNRKIEKSKTENRKSKIENRKSKRAIGRSFPANPNKHKHKQARALHAEAGRLRKGKQQIIRIVKSSISLPSHTNREGKSPCFCSLKGKSSTKTGWLGKEVARKSRWLENLTPLAPSAFTSCTTTTTLHQHHRPILKPSPPDALYCSSTRRILGRIYLLCS